ncbi:MAG: 4Fe-4S binding protein [Desulfuromonadales bacterium]|nr:4Fe-4S binding protein [Desulfuromonadales bacterium]
MRIPGKMASEVLRHSVKTPATCNYPHEKQEMPDKFRGKIIFKSENCIGCKICVRDCPSEAIEIVKVAEKVFDAVFHLDRCLYCGQCVESCPKGALETSVEYELAQIDKDKLRIVFHAKTGDKPTEEP